MKLLSRRRPVQLGLVLVRWRTAASLEKNLAASLSGTPTEDVTGARVSLRRNVKECSLTRLGQRPPAVTRREPSAENPQTGVGTVRHTRQSRGPLKHRGAPLYPGVCPYQRSRLSAPRPTPQPQGFFSPYFQSACKENPFSERPEMTRSQTVQNLPSGRGPAPGHGFPLIRRQVQKRPSILDGDLEALEQRGVELERSIRDGRTGKEDQMLTEWFGLVQEQHTLLRRNKELVYLTKQQILEDRQADVEYKLRCLLNKPEKDWDQEDRGQEQQLMAELVTIIEQRNQIISSLDQDRYMETNKKCFQKDGLKKTKGKLKAPKVFKMLNHKQESSKEPAEKKS
uniref:BMERB domain-containing protein n=1 Tax=Poecilia latipinna TaxID=48699 RepID=A0A3B3TIP2_9TELE